MNQKQIITLFTVVGSVVGGFIPLLWGAGELSFSSVIFGAGGAMLGIYIGYKSAANPIFYFLLNCYRI